MASEKTEHATLQAARANIEATKEKSVDPPMVEAVQHAPQQVPPEVLAKAFVKEGAPPAKPAEERYFFLREQKQTEWLLYIKKDVTVQDLLRPRFWSAIARKLKAFDTVIVMSEDRQLYVELLVVASAQTWAEMRFKIEPIVIPASVAGKSTMTDYDVIDGGLIKKWCVVEKVTGREINTMSATPEVAWNWLREFLSQNNRAA